jgi:hypothetical protein
MSSETRDGILAVCLTVVVISYVHDIYTLSVGPAVAGLALWAIWKERRT